VAVLSNLSAAVDRSLAADLRARGVPVLEGTRSGLRALGHLRDHATRPRRAEAAVDAARRDRWLARLETGPVDPFALLADYGVPVAPTRTVRAAGAAVDAAEALGYPVVLKTGDASTHHKVDVDGVRLGVRDAAGVRAAYADLAERLGPAVVVQAQAPSVGVEVALGLWHDPLVGPLVLVAAGGTLVELLGERSVALPPVDRARAGAMVGRLRLARLLAGVRGRPAVAVDALAGALASFSQLGVELGDRLEAVDVNPLVVHPGGVVAVDALVVAR
jgi:acyl-CoA synthetase (NDP forming)